MLSIAACTMVNIKANVNEKNIMWKKEKNEYPKWKFIDPSGVKVEEKEEVRLLYTLSLYICIYIFTHNINCNEMRKAHKACREYNDDEVLSSAMRLQ